MKRLLFMWPLGKRERMNQNKLLPIINFYEMDLIDEQRVAKQKALAAFWGYHQYKITFED